MPERDTTPVTIILDRQRPYRVRDEDKDAVWVGPGEVSVPTWVAQEWGMAPRAAAKTDQSGDDTLAEKPEGDPAESGGPFDGLALTEPQIAALAEAGYLTKEDLLEATDDELVGVATIGKATVRNIRDAMKGTADRGPRTADSRSRADSPSVSASPSGSQSAVPSSQSL